MQSSVTFVKLMEMHIFAQLSCTLVCLEPTALFWDNIRGHTVGGALLSRILLWRESQDISSRCFFLLHIRTFIRRFGLCMGAAAVFVAGQELQKCVANHFNSLKLYAFYSFCKAGRWFKWSGFVKSQKLKKLFTVVVKGLDWIIWVKVQILLIEYYSSKIPLLLKVILCTFAKKKKGEEEKYCESK